MEEYRTYVYNKSKKKVVKRTAYHSFLVLVILIIIYMAVFGILGIGISLIGAIVIIITILRMKNYDDKYLGITAYGDRGMKFFITKTGFKMGDSELPFSELKDLVIYVDEYAGMPRDLFGIHHGGNNEISFNHKGQPYNINYIIKNKADFHQVEKLVEQIEAKY